MTTTTSRSTTTPVHDPETLAPAVAAAAKDVPQLADAWATDTWLATLGPAPLHSASHEDVIEALDEVRDEGLGRSG